MYPHAYDYCASLIHTYSEYCSDDAAGCPNTARVAMRTHMLLASERNKFNILLLILISSFSFDVGIGQTFSIFIISIAGAESVIGLSILVAYYRLTGNISLRNNINK